MIYLQAVLSIILCILSSITDCKNKKIYNKLIVTFLWTSLIIYCAFYRNIDTQFILNYFINLTISLIVGYLFYYLKIWAAGDAKLFFSVVAMIPFEVYETSSANYFPAVVLIILIFSIGFLAIFIETIYLWMKDKDKFLKIRPNKISTEALKSFLLNYFEGYLLLLLFNNITLKYSYHFRMNNPILFTIINMLILCFIYNLSNAKSTKIKLTIILFIMNIIYLFTFGITPYSFDIKTLVLVISILIFRRTSEKYNYEAIRVNDIKPRMILSHSTILMFYGSNVKGLPHYTTEDTDSRITQEEVDSIKRWGKTKKGKESIIIVRHLPFAPFILLGTGFFWIIRLMI